MAATTAPQRPPGPNGTTQPDAKEITEYQKILNIRDEIFSGNHPRLKVPQNVIRKITPRPVHTPSTPPVPQLSAHQQPQQRQSAEAIGIAKGQESRVAPGSATGTPSAATVSAAGRVSTAKPASEIDPIFLTKSDDLIRAEIQLQRQRLERSVRDQLEQKRYNVSQKPAPHESKPDFDVSEVLDKAWDIVRPISINEAEAANGNVAASDSFDENSFYSSRAPDSPQNVEPSQASPVSEKQSRAMDVDNADADVRIDRRSNGARDYEPAPYNPVPLPQYDAGRRSPDNIAPRRTSPPRQRMPEPQVVYEEPEYSPPGPDVPMGRPREAGDEGMDSARHPIRRSDYKPSDFEQDPRRIRVVNNHITSPAAPQPSRVSPLAVSRVPSFQGRRGRQDRQADKVSVGNGSRRTSPEGPPQQPMARKRRRVQEPRDRRPVEERRVVESPEIPYIKPEPVSPPPFTDVPVSSSYDRPRVARAPAVVDLDTPHYSPAAVERRVYDERYVDDAAVPRASSRLGYRPVRETRDLRRIASLQNARQEYTQDYAEPEPVPRYARAASYAVTDRQAPAERDVYYEEPAQPSYARRYVTRAPSPTSPRYREEYAEAPRVMAPPQRRIVVDADGNRYYESVAAPKLAPPPPQPRFTRVEEYDDAPVSHGSVRAVSVMEHPYGERRYQQEMPPPPPVYRRAPEYGRSVAPETRVYDREPEQRHAVLRSGSVQVVDYPPRRASFVEDEGMYPREEMVRMSSVRPAPARYEEQREPVPRMQSVRPAAREMSVYVQDDPRPHPTYLPAERAAYPVGRPVREERYYEDEEPSKLGHGPEAVRRVPRHY